MKMFYTRYALTGGIKEVVAVECDACPGYYRVPGCYLGRLGRDLFESRAEAEEKAKDMASKKMAKLRKQVAELEMLAKAPRWNGGKL